MRGDLQSPRAGLVRRFGSDRRGNIAIMFVFMLGVLMLFAGGAVDFTRYNTVRADLIESMDAAGLAMAQIDAFNGPEIQKAEADGGKSGREEYLKAQGKKFFAENFKHSGWVQDLEVDFELTSTRIVPKATGKMKTLFLGIGAMLQFGSEANSLDSLSLASDTAIVRRDDGNIEVAMVMDITGSMGGDRITDLKSAAKEMVDIVVREDQTEWYSKAALVPYSMGVNAGAYAGQARGAIPAGKTITNVTNSTSGSSKSISGIEKDKNPVRVTSNSHGFSNGDIICIEGVTSSGSGSNKLATRVNNKAYRVSDSETNRFRLQNVSGSSWDGSYSSGGTAVKCEVIVTTENSHGFSTNDYVHIKGVVDLEGINNDITNSGYSDDVWRITKKTDTTFALNNPAGVQYKTYTSGGAAWCTVEGCEYFYFTNADGSKRAFQVTSCVSERTGSEKETDAAPTTSYVGRLYKGPGNTCPAEPIVPLLGGAEGKATLKASIDKYVASGSTAGQIGVGWGWYMLSPNFSYLFPEGSKPGPYDPDVTTKVAVIMTDGEFNSPYCDGVIAKNAGSGSGGSADHIDCNAENGNPYTQAKNVCAAMKAKDPGPGIVIYTIGFDISDSTSVTDLLTSCASGPEYVYFAATGDELKEIYRQIGSEITKLHISK